MVWWAERLATGWVPFLRQGPSFLWVNRREDSVKTKAKAKADPSHHPRDARMGSLPSSGPFVPLGEQAGEQREDKGKSQSRSLTPSARCADGFPSFVRALRSSG